MDNGGIIATCLTILALGDKFFIKVRGSFNILFSAKNDEKDTILIHSPKLLRDLKLKFGHIVRKEKEAATFGVLEMVIMHPQESNVMTVPEKQMEFQSGVRMLLYLIKCSRPEISNPVQELTKVVDRATPVHWKAIKHTIKYVLDTENYALTIKPNMKDGAFKLGRVSDSEFGGDKDTRGSVSISIHCFLWSVNCMEVESWEKPYSVFYRRRVFWYIGIGKLSHFRKSNFRDHESHSGISYYN
jgi:hypothetical protein